MVPSSALVESLSAPQYDLISPPQLHLIKTQSFHSIIQWPESLPNGTSACDRHVRLNIVYKSWVLKHHLNYTLSETASIAVYTVAVGCCSTHTVSIFVTRFPWQLSNYWQIKLCIISSAVGWEVCGKTFSRATLSREDCYVTSGGKSLSKTAQVRGQVISVSNSHWLFFFFFFRRRQTSHQLSSNIDHVG